MADSSSALSGKNIDGDDVPPHLVEGATTNISQVDVDLDVEAGVLTAWACVSLLKFSFESTCTERHRIKFRLADTNKSNNRTAKMAPIERDIIAIFKNLFSTGLCRRHQHPGCSAPPLQDVFEFINPTPPSTPGAEHPPLLAPLSQHVTPRVLNTP